MGRFKGTMTSGTHDSGKGLTQFLFIFTVDGGTKDPESPHLVATAA